MTFTLFDPDGAEGWHALGDEASRLTVRLLVATIGFALLTLFGQPIDWGEVIEDGDTP